MRPRCQQFQSTDLKIECPDFRDMRSLENLDVVTRSPKLNINFDLTSTWNSTIIYKRDIYPAHKRIYTVHGLCIYVIEFKCAFTTLFNTCSIIIISQAGRKGNLI